MLKPNEEHLTNGRRHLASDRPNTDFDNCRCDITVNSCDLNCCCDSDCSDDVIKRWSKTEFTCKYEGITENVLDASECYDRGVVSELADLQYGLRINTNNLQSFLCVLSTRESEPKDFIEDTFTTTTNAEFATTIEDAENNFSEPLKATSTTPETFYTLGDAVYKSDGTKFRLSTPNSFGTCEETRAIKFQETMNTTT